MERWHSGAPSRPLPTRPRPLQAADYINTTENTSYISERRTRAPDPPGAAKSPGAPRGSQPHQHRIAAAPSRAFRAGSGPSGEAAGTAPGERAPSRGRRGTAGPPLPLHHPRRQRRLPESAETFPAQHPRPGSPRFPPAPLPAAALPPPRRAPARPGLRAADWAAAGGPRCSSAPEDAHLGARS